MKSFHAPHHDSIDDIRPSYALITEGLHRLDPSLRLILFVMRSGMDVSRFAAIDLSRR
eukprot:CAMPEP_0113669678 /NCGR_PEP_ID=MMETSP0038_2-20120614/4709_1 /TAXON_ID=2898 /ORGANISM="Cryptomonas paramecium" /LENGTH=57 /DNA_ID=CAMNT_0000585599 /DNA_START=17 /DNA_END=187 /DNA_ORIENTATION=+ /assembly_acc=CAM_ASM_000170